MLTIRNLRLDPASPTLGELSLEASKIHVVLGRNRSGKSALCRLLAGLPGPASGELWFAGHSWAELGPRQRPVAMVYQAFVNYPHWTVAANLASSLVAQGLPSAEIDARVQMLAERLQLTELLRRLPNELSGGQQQRVAIGRALAKGAQLLLLDEPLVNLDYKLREALEVELLGLLRDSGATVIYTSSDPQDALGLADNVVLLSQHQVVQWGSPLQLYQHPGSMLAADLLSDPGVNRLPQTGSAENAAYVRPEQLLLADGPRPTSAVAEQLSWREFDMTVQAVETSGSHTFVHGQVQGCDWIAKLPGLPSINIQTILRLRCLESDVLQFSASDTAPEAEPEAEPEATPATVIKTGQAAADG